MEKFNPDQIYAMLHMGCIVHCEHYTIDSWVKPYFYGYDRYGDRIVINMKGEICLPTQC